MRKRVSDGETRWGCSQQDKAQINIITGAAAAHRPLGGSTDHQVAAHTTRWEHTPPGGSTDH